MRNGKKGGEDFPMRCFKVVKTIRNILAGEDFANWNKFDLQASIKPFELKHI